MIPKQDVQHDTGREGGYVLYVVNRGAAVEWWGKSTRVRIAEGSLSTKICKSNALVNMYGAMSILPA